MPLRPHRDQQCASREEPSQVLRTSEEPQAGMHQVTIVSDESVYHYFI